MLSEDLKGANRQSVTDGITLYKIPSDCFSPGLCKFSAPKKNDPRLEIFFCSGGSMLLRRKANPPLHISKQEILLLTADSDIGEAEIAEAPVGYLLSIELSSARDTLDGVFRVLGHPDVFDGRISRMLSDHCGCIRIHRSCWNEAAFAVLRSLPYPEQSCYCVLKSAELLYLLCAHHALLDGFRDDLPAPGYSAGIIHNVQDYMVQHLDEKLTISFLSHHFHISSTALKSGFHALYGMPVHSWLLNRRMQQAADLLQFSDLNILQIAQSVGYEGVSQFNLVFKRQYGVAPSQYRKLSETIEIRPIP